MYKEEWEKGLNAKALEEVKEIVINWVQYYSDNEDKELKTNILVRELTRLQDSGLIYSWNLSNLRFMDNLLKLNFQITEAIVEYQVFVWNNKEIAIFMLPFGEGLPRFIWSNEGVSYE